MSSSDVTAAKTSLRRELLARRTRHTDADRAQIAATLADVFAAEFEPRIRGGGAVSAWSSRCAWSRCTSRSRPSPAPAP